MALAYLDANSGSLIVSALAAGTAGVGVAAKVGWRRVKGKLRPGAEAAEPVATDEAPAAEA